MTLTDTDLDWNALRRTHEIASALSRDLNDIPALANRRTPSDTHDLTDISLPTLDLPFPHHILASISNLSIPTSIHQKLAERSSQIFTELQGQYVAAFERACLAVVRSGPMFEGSINSLQKVYETLYQKQHTRLAQHWVSTVSAEVAARQQPSPVSKMPFKNEFTPALEKYFSLNGYPTVAHRTILAQKCEMTPRQIEVWFQNHRNRAKKEGKNIQRLDSDFPLRQALAFFPSQNRLPTPPVDEKTTMKDPPMDTVPLQASTQALSTFLDDSYKPRPPHTFPATSSSGYPDPFPNDQGVFKFPPPLWRRQPATTPISSLAVDMDEFTQMFHLKLNFSESFRRRGASPPKPDSPSSEPWFTATTTTFAPSAPLPGFFPVPDIPQRTSPGTTILLHPSNPEPTFGSSSLQVSTALSFGSSNQGPRRKTRPLPRRAPQKPRTNLFGSRTSSFASDASTRSRVSSSSSNHSSSPELSTPPPLPNLDLPVFYNEDQRQDLFDFSPTEVDAAYSFTSFVPYQESNITPIYYPSSKIADLPSFDIPFQDFGHNLGEIFC